MRQFVHRFLRPTASLLPYSALQWLDHHVPINRDPEIFNWSFWTDASYLKTCRADWRAGRIR